MVFIRIPSLTVPGLGLNLSEQWSASKELTAGTSPKASGQLTRLQSKVLPGLTLEWTNSSVKWNADSQPIQDKGGEWPTAVIPTVRKLRQEAFTIVILATH